MKYGLCFLAGALAASAAWVFCIGVTGRRGYGRTESGSHLETYAALRAAVTPDGIRAALEQLVEGGSGEPREPLPPLLSRKVFRFLRTVPRGEKGPYIEEDCSLVGHLAALAGDVELLRKMIHTYFGSCPSELRGGYIERFLQVNPDLFFSLPDAWELWEEAGGARWCCDSPAITIPIIGKRAFSRSDALRMLEEIDAETRDSETAGTQWAAEAKKPLAEYRHLLLSRQQSDK